jgi:amino acid adenylation domain-containing protein/thioester reductase-like protein
MESMQEKSEVETSGTPHSSDLKERLLKLHLEKANRRRPGSRTIVPRALEEGPLPLSFAQERLWFLDQLESVGFAYNMPMRLELEGRLDTHALENSFAELIRRHESLRTRFASIGGRPVQIIDSPPQRYTLPVHDLTGLAEPARSRRADQLSTEEAQRPFDLTKGPVLRVTLLRLSEQKHVLLLTMHHIVADGWSLGVLNRELSALYAAQSQGAPSTLPPLAAQYADFAIWQRQRLQGEVLEEHLRYWREKLDGAPPHLQLPTDRPRPAVATFRGSEFVFHLSRPVRKALEQLGREHGATLFMVVLAAFQVLLSRYSGQPDIVVGTPIAGRTTPGTEDLIGFFVNMLTIRTRVTGSFRQFLEQVKTTTLEAYAHQELPFEKLVMDLRPERNLTRQPVFQVTLAMHNFPQEKLDIPGLSWSWPAAPFKANFDLTLHLYDDPDGLRGVFEYSTDLFDVETIERMTSHWQVLLGSIQSDPDCAVETLALLDVGERTKLLQEWNATAHPVPDNGRLHELFRIQAARTPSAVALTDESRQMTFAELDASSDRVAQRLHELGTGPDDVVALCTERSVEMVVGLLGILKAGAAYLPLDPSYPPERLKFMLKDSNTKLLLTQRSLEASFSGSSAQTLLIDADQADLGEHSRFINCDVTSRNLAYVIYTSGSTGAPKGVCISHAAACNQMLWMIQRFRFTAADVFLQKTPLSFDASVWEVFVPLLCGARLVLAVPEGHKDPAYLCEAVRRNGVTVLQLVPSMLQLLCAEPGFTSCTGLKQLFSGGEPLSAELREKIFSKLDIDLHNLYGPTETCVQVLAYSCRRGDTTGSVSVPLGRPVWNTQVYVLDSRQQPVPIGVPGELYIGGVQLARGYLGRPELTAERFVTHPFADPHTYVYRTGDLVRYLRDGNLEFFGRLDDQVKVRGYRIELAEIENQLLKHPHVKEAVVLAREQASGERGLVAYVVGDRAAAENALAGQSSEGMRDELVQEWETLYEETYGTQNRVIGPSFVGWNSSYTGDPIPEDEMHEWLSCTIDRIRRLRPKRVLEIGCGVGLILQHIAPECDQYVGTDISAPALARLHEWMSNRPEIRHVQLLHRSATQLADFPEGSFDTIVLNSVVQYFPDINYLLDTLRQAVRLLRTGGAIFVGDIRHLGLLATFHSAVQLSKAGASVNVGQLRRRVARAMAQDKELVLDPTFFSILGAHIPRLGAADVQLKRGHAANELTRYRYDVVLRCDDSVPSRIACTSIDWEAHIGSISQLDKALSERRWPAVRLRRVPNGRLTRELAAETLIQTSDERLDSTALRREISKLPLNAPEPESFWRLANAHGYEVSVTWPSEGSVAGFDVELVDRAQVPALPREQLQMIQAKPLRSYATEPLELSFRQELVPRLRAYLKERLPEYMVPTAWMVLRQLPTLPNGKVDRRALPAPQARPEEMGEFVPPRTEVERKLADLWAQLLRVDQVGVHDNFFDLGGHSLLVVKTVYEINESLRCNLKVADVYGNPTIAHLARRVRGEGAEEALVDLDAEARLDERLAARCAWKPDQSAAILLTGATGFVGRFLLSRLLSESDRTVYCIVRASSSSQAYGRLLASLREWGLWRDDFEGRLVAIPGDLRESRLGVDDRTFRRLCSDVDVIYHCATSMNHLETYSIARRANVDSVRDLLELAVTDRTKQVSYISTLGVFNPPADGTVRAVDEFTLIDHEQHSIASGYLASKWVAEKMFLAAVERGVPCNIFRLGFVWADSHLGRYDELQREYRVFKSCLLSGFGIRNYGYAMAPTPVDYVARAIVCLANQHRSSAAGIFHLSSNLNAMREGVFERCNRLLERPLQLLDLPQWIEEIRKLHHSGREMPIMPLMDSAFATRPSGGLIAFDCSRTQQELERHGIREPEISDEVLKRFLEGLIPHDTDPRASFQPGTHKEAALSRATNEIRA